MDKLGRVVALEEHYWDAEVVRHFSAAAHDEHPDDLRERLFDLGKLRLQAMDRAGIDVQVLSHGGPAFHRLEPAVGVELARRANDKLHETIRAKPERFAAFASLPAGDPQASADELERTVTSLGFKGAMVHGITLLDGKWSFIDDKRFWPIFERAQALDVPIYIHSARPHPAVIEAYYKDYADELPGLLTAGWGFTIETATQVVRLILSRVLEKYPKLQFIVGHMGESIPFSLWRIEKAISRAGKRHVCFRDLFCEHFHITTSGNFSIPALLCSVLEMGADRIMFSVDYPYEDNLEGIEWIRSAPLSEGDRQKILYRNAARLLKLESNSSNKALA